MQKMREALVGLAQAVQDFMATKGRNFYPDMAVALEAALAALDLPRRNCDVGTAEEQADRFAEFCDNNKIIDDTTGCDQCYENCPAKSPFLGECSFRWSQLPYEESEDNGEQK